MKIILLCCLLLTAQGISQNVKWEDRMNTDNSIAGLQGRGWVVIDNDGGGTTPAWFQPGTTVFKSFEGHDSGYVASNFLGANANGLIDHWLISPQLNVETGDSLVFLTRAPVPDGTLFRDSIFILVSLGSTNIADFTQIGDGFEVPTDGWQSFYLTFGVTNTVRFAIRYRLFDSGENGSTGNFIGLDYFSLYSKSGATYPQNIQLSKTFSFGNPENKSSYRLVGIPGNNNTSVTTFFKGEHKKDWNVFYDNGIDSPNSSDYLIEFNGQATFNFTPGKGFWALSRNPVTVSGQVNTVALLANNTFNIPLHSGWNIISNPFEKSVTLPGIVLHAFNGNFTQTNTMVPYEAYYYMNANNNPSLSISYPFGTNLPKNNDFLYFLSEKNIKLKVSSSEFSSEVIAAFDETAKNDYDDKDYFAPPGNFEEVNIRLVNENLSTSYKQLFIEHRPEVGEGQAFDVVIKNITGEKIKVISEGIENFNEHEVFLVDERLKIFYNLKENNEINISGNHQRNEFKLLIGKQNFINNFIDNSLPKEFVLHQNYPNPFNPSTIIRFQVPQKEHITIKVYDILGNLVKVLLDEIKDTGYYEVEFNGSSLSSGIYFCKFSGGPVRDIKKMTLIK